MVRGYGPHLLVPITRFSRVLARHRRRGSGVIRAGAARCARCAVCAPP